MSDEFNTTYLAEGEEDGSKKYRVLFVDDDPAFLELLKRRFEDSRYHADFVEDAETALYKLSQQSFNVLVTDMSMPGIDGTMLLKESWLLYPEVERIALSGKLDYSYVSEAINLGHVFKYLSKPIQDKVLKLAIYEAIKHRERIRRQFERANAQQQNLKQRTKQLGEALTRTKGTAKRAYNESLGMLTELAANNALTPEQPDEVAEIASRLANRLNFAKPVADQIRIAAQLNDYQASEEDEAESAGFSEQGRILLNMLRRLGPFSQAAEIIECAAQENEIFVHDYSEEVIQGAAIIEVASHFWHLRRVENRNFDDAVGYLRQLDTQDEIVDLLDPDD